MYEFSQFEKTSIEELLRRADFLTDKVTITEKDADYYDSNLPEEEAPSVIMRETSKN